MIFCSGCDLLVLMYHTRTHYHTCTQALRTLQQATTSRRHLIMVENKMASHG